MCLHPKPLGIQGVVEDSSMQNTLTQKSRGMVSKDNLNVMPKEKGPKMLDKNESNQIDHFNLSPNKVL